MNQWILVLSGFGIGWLFFFLRSLLLKSWQEKMIEDQRHYMQGWFEGRASAKRDDDLEKIMSKVKTDEKLQ